MYAADEVVRGGRRGVVEEGLRGGGERSIGLRHEDEGTLDGVAAVEDGLLGAGDAADRHSLDGVLALDCGEGGVADGIGVARDRLDDAASGGQFLIELAGVLGAGDGLEAVARAAAGLTADAGDFARFAADLAPVGDLTGEDLGDLLDGEVLDFAARIDDDGDAVKGDNGLGQAAGLLLVLEGAGGKTDVRAAVAGGLNAGAGAGGIVGDAHAAVVGHELLAQRADDLFHRGRAVGRDAAAELFLGLLLRLVVIGVVGGSGLAAAACEQREAHHSGEHKCKCLFHLSFLISHVDFGLSSFHNAKHNGAL